MQSLPSIGRALYRIVFRSGSPLRIHFEPSLLGWAIVAFLLLSSTCLRLYQSGFIEIGLFLFVSLSSLYIAAALMTRKVPRTRLRLTMQAAMLLLATAALLLLLITPILYVWPLAALPLRLLIVLAALTGISNCVQFALACGRISAFVQTGLFVLASATLFTILLQLLQSVFS